MAIKRAGLAALGALTLSGAVSAQPTGIPTFDAAADLQRIEQIREAVDTTEAAMRIADTTRDNYEAITGVRNMDDVMRLALVREFVPRDYRSLYRCARYRNASCALDRALDILEEFEVEDRCARIEDDLRRQSCQERAAKGAIDHAVALDALDSINERNENIERLSARIRTTRDPAESAKLQARIETEALAIQNEALALQAARDAADSYDAILEQRDREIEELTWSSRRTPDVAPLDFGG